MAPGPWVPGGVSFQSGGVLIMNVNMTASKHTLTVPATAAPRSHGPENLVLKDEANVPVLSLTSPPGERWELPSAPVLFNKIQQNWIKGMKEQMRC